MGAKKLLLWGVVLFIGGAFLPFFITLGYMLLVDKFGNPYLREEVARGGIWMVPMATSTFSLISLGFLFLIFGGMKVVFAGSKKSKS